MAIFREHTLHLARYSPALPFAGVVVVVVVIIIITVIVVVVVLS